GGGTAAVVVAQEGRKGEQRLAFDVRFRCRKCGTEFDEPEQQLFSFNNPIGACPECEGFGRVSGLDEDKVIPNPALGIRQKPVAPFNTPAYCEMQEELLRMARRRHIPLDAPYKDLSARQKKLVWEGDGRYAGIRGFFNWLESKRYKVHVRVMIARYRSYTTCPACKGMRLKGQALNVLVAGKSIADLWQMSVSNLRGFFRDICLSTRDEETSDVLLRELRSRIGYLDDVGLGYLTLGRQTRTLSGGESQRINLASALGSSLTNTLYVLDEPTVGLHARDTHRLLDILRKLIQKGNTVVVVEHDPEVIDAAGNIIDIGPGAGELGGTVIFQGPAAGLLAVASSETARQMEAHSRRAISPYARRPTRSIHIFGAAEHNLKNLDVRIPLGVLCCVTGVSGSGKTTLVHNILYDGYRRATGDGRRGVGRCKKIRGFDNIDDVILVDQSPIGRSTRSNAVTYVKAYDEVRRALASTTKARIGGVTAGEFSFNIAGGRCETCKGIGTITHEMYFLADVTVTCADCEGKKFKKKILDIRYGGKNINDILEMTVTEAMRFFRNHARVTRRLQPLADVGLGYLRLGQNTATLSGGEAQRLKLAGHLVHSNTDKRYLFIFDEPTTGLHMADVTVLLRVFHRLVNQGHSVLAIEHNLDFITQADWIIDLGPEGGDEGGYLLAEGTIEDVAKCAKSYTGAFLKNRIAEAEAAGEHGQ
ncbi:MAG: excinuclease ABC subunit UvrA, partial [Planctomycetia bacterium]|nr:excinuclease ABC subunit UvrA [Planctomycetia bacterium]